MFPGNRGEGAGSGQRCRSMRPLPRHITALYMTMVLSFMLMFHAALVGADVLVYSQVTRRPVEGMDFPNAPAHFGPQIPFDGIKGMLVYARPEGACSPIDEPPARTLYSGKWLVLIRRCGCTFEEKVRNAERAGFDAAIVHNVNSSALEPMSANGPTNISIPSIFIGEDAGLAIKDSFQYNKGFYIVINSNLPFNINTHLLLPFAIVVGVCFMVMMVFMIFKCVKDRLHARRHRLPSSSLKKIPVLKFKKNDPSMRFETCAICLEDYLDGDKLRVLPCAHAYHCKCIDPWLTGSRRVCPMCKRKVFASDERHPSDDDDDDDDHRVDPTPSRVSAVVNSDTSEDERAPLISVSTSQATQNRRGNSQGGGTFQPQRENPFRRASRNPFNSLSSSNSSSANDHPEAASSSTYSASPEDPSLQSFMAAVESLDRFDRIVFPAATEGQHVAGADNEPDSTPRMSVNSRREEVQGVAVLPNNPPAGQSNRSWWRSIWSMVADV